MCREAHNGWLSHFFIFKGRRRQHQVKHDYRRLHPGTSFVVLRVNTQAPFLSGDY